jgi:flagellar motor switch protein FliM
MLHRIASGEAVLCVSMEILLGAGSGLLRLGIPSMMIRALHNKFNQQWSASRAEPTEAEQTRMLHLLRRSQMRLDARLRGPKIYTKDLLVPKPGDIVALDHAIERPLCLEVNGLGKWRGLVVDKSGKRTFVIEDMDPDSGSYRGP